MIFERVSNRNKELFLYYTNILLQTFPDTDLLSTYDLVRCVDISNLHCVIMFDDNGMQGGIIYSRMHRSKVLFIHFVNAKNNNYLLDLLTVVMLDESYTLCISCNINNVYFHRLDINYIKPNLLFEKHYNESYLFIYGNDYISKNDLIDLLYEYYKRIANIKQPEKNDSFLDNLDILSKSAPFISCI